MLKVSILGSVAFLLTFFITRLLIRYSEKMGMMDIPNKRSSHSRPTPKGGGVGFFVVFILISLGFYSFSDYHFIVSPLVFGAPVVILLGWFDDRYSLPPFFRLFIHFLVALFIYIFVTQNFEIQLNISFLPEGFWINSVFCVLFITWFINLYNFMDGVDGQAASTAIVGSLLMAVIAGIHDSYRLSVIYCLISYTVSGFLFYNWSPARIFMGNTGSYFLGFLFASLALISKVHANVSFYSHVIIFGFFIFDTTFVLIWRTMKKRPLFKAHQTFIFHKLMKKGWSHGEISIFYVMIMILWLFPMANLASIYDDLGLLIVLMAYFPLLILAVYNRAGET